MLSLSKPSGCQHLITGLLLALVVLLAVGCGSASKLDNGSTCGQWVTASVAARANYVVKTARLTDVPPPELLSVTGLAVSYITKVCQAATASGQANTKTLGLVVLQQLTEAEHQVAQTSRGQASESNEPSQPSFANTVSGTIRDAQGNRANVTVGIGSPQPLTKLSDPVPRTCDSVITEAGHSVSSAVAVPMEATVRLTSNVKVPLSVQLNKFSTLKHGAVQPNLETAVLWATQYGSGPAQCAGGVEGSSIEWKAEELTPQAASSWRTWLVFVEAITPDDPSGKEATSKVLLQPEASFTNGYMTDDFLEAHGSGWVRCPEADDTGPYAAISPAVARVGGCGD